VIVDYAGFGTTTDDAIETVGVNGTVVQVGMGVDRAEISTTTLMLKQVNLLGSLGGTNEDAAEVLEMMAAGKVSSEVEIVGFDDIDESIKRFERGDATGGRLVAMRD
jgi:alcohol dehydrogenase, propanol-preferring